MRRSTLKNALLFMVANTILFLHFSCSESPFEEEVDSTLKKSIEGSVILPDNESPDGVYIWLEDTDLNTVTDTNGEFKLELPESNSQQMNLENGIFNLFYYVANFKIASSTVVVSKGQFVPSTGDLNGNGELIGSKPLVKILRIKTEIDPATVNASFAGQIQVAVTLQAIQDSVTVVLPKSLEGSTSAVIFKRIGIGESIVLADDSKFVFSTTKIGSEEEILEYGFTLTPGMLPDGEYNIVPFFLIKQENMPPQLISSIGTDVDRYGVEFLKMPFKREEGKFVILNF